MRTIKSIFGNKISKKTNRGQTSAGPTGSCMLPKLVFPAKVSTNIFAKVSPAKAIPSMVALDLSLFRMFLFIFQGLFKHNFQLSRTK
jgi:hypothetical protein